MKSNEHPMHESRQRLLSVVRKKEPDVVDERELLISFLKLLTLNSKIILSVWE